MPRLTPRAQEDPESTSIDSGEEKGTSNDEHENAPASQFFTPISGRDVQPGQRVLAKDSDEPQYAIRIAQQMYLVPEKVYRAILKTTSTLVDGGELAPAATQEGVLEQWQFDAIPQAELQRFMKACPAPPPSSQASQTLSVSADADPRTAALTGAFTLPGAEGPSFDVMSIAFQGLGLVTVIYLVARACACLMAMCTSGNGRRYWLDEIDED